MAEKTSKFNLGSILIVDDEQELMTVLCETLTGKGYETTGFTSGEKALEVLKHKDFDVLLTDLMMPGMDGITLFKSALGIDRNIISIIMTGQGTVQTAVEAMQSGAFDYILKPFRINLLLPLITRAMEVRRLKLENIQLQETVAVHELATLVAFPFDIRTILNKLLDAALQQCQADEASIMLTAEDDKSELYIAIAKGKHLEQFIGTRVPMDDSIAGWVARNHQLVTLNGKVEDARFKPVNPRKDINSAVSMPIIAGGNLLGVLNVNTTQSRRAFTLGQIKGLSILISIVAPVLESSWLYDKIRQAEEKYRSIFENSVEGIFQTTPEGLFITANPALARMYGYDTPEELIATVKSIKEELYVRPEERDLFRSLLHEKNVVNNFEAELRRKDEATFWVSMNARKISNKDGEILYYEGTIEDITERKKAEERIITERQKFLSLVDNAPFGMIMIGQDGDFQYFNAAFEEMFGYTPYDVPNGKTWSQKVYPDPAYRHSVASAWKADIEKLKAGEQISETFEVTCKDGSRKVVKFRPVQMASGQCLVACNDITGLIKAEDALKQSMGKLERAMGGTISVMAHAVEVRDPYTAGHQRRVTDLAFAIGKALNLTEHEIEGLRMAGLIHDIGKLYVPAEILSKPGKLSEIEFELVKTHVEAGYDILKDVEFPWPVAAFVRQHHEKIDGSGYPQGLRNGQIFLEAKILTVADVVEAMASHRPYRPSLGIDLALEEIVKNKGILYDPGAVDACVRLFREKGFKFE
ncbi:MAG: PAS domain S-box protein [Syntrophorhabdaceae bacterium]|nr:PAS domain S-box protein [Syntrophorhabdaceae bacterium]MDD5242747.1 PAS domain S-box protein [Syntrophorhabdaceae bacterium]